MSQQINLVSPLLLKKRYAFGLREMAIALGLIVLAALAWAGYLYYQASGLEAYAARQEEHQASAQQALDKLNAAANRPASALLNERVKFIQSQVAQRELLLATIGDSFNGKPPGFAARMTAFAHSRIEGVWLNGFTLTPDHVALKGSALSADLLTSYLDQLGKQPSFSGMRFSGMKAEPAQATQDSGIQAGALPEHIDFDLYSGIPETPDGQGGMHGR